MSFHYQQKQKELLNLAGSGARHIMAYGGSRSGKTFALLCALVVRALKAPGSRHAVIRYRYKSVRQSVGLETLPAVMRLRFPEVPYLQNKSDGFFRLANGSEIWLIGLDDPNRADKALGKEYSTLYFNECSELIFDSVESIYSRLAQKVPPLINKCFYDCNPPSKSHWTYRMFIQALHPKTKAALQDPADYAALLLNPTDNAENLDPDYISKTLGNMSPRQRDRFLYGKFLDDVEGALWTADMIDSFRVVSPPDDFRRIVVAVDPAVTANEASDETGIVVAAEGTDGHYYILEDASMKAPPLTWAHKVDDLYNAYDADLVIGEVNNGGDLVNVLMEKVNPDIPFRQVRASHGKRKRAEPTAELYRKGRVHHVGVFSELEEQMTSYNPLTYAGSPDRMDAAVWAITELSRSSSRMIQA